jgi:site-specific DNA recombinase
MKHYNHKIKYYIYLRKSSESDEKQIQSIERQADEVHKLVTYQGLEITGTFQESRSAMTPNNRPEFIKMIRGLKAGKANGIICWHINRLARNPLESGIIQQLLEDGKIQSIITKDREYTSADNAIIFSVESSLATQYSKDLGKMVKSGMEKKVSLGLAPIKAPIGYINTKTAEHGSNYIIKDKERFDIVRRIWDMMLTGLYVPSKILQIIVNETNLKPYTSRKAVTASLSRSGIYKILTNPFYAGLFIYKGQLYQGKHEPMITVEEFDKVQQILGRDGKPRQHKFQYAYTGIMTCAECGSAITATTKFKMVKSTGLNKSYTYYYCTNRKVGKNCQSRQPLTVKELEEQIISEVENVSITELFLQVAKEALKKNAGELIEQAYKIELQQIKQIQLIEKELKNLLQLRIANEISDIEYQAEKQIREMKLLGFKENIKRNKSNPLFLFKEIEEKLLTLVNLSNRYQKSAELERRKIFLSIGENYILEGKKLSIIKPKWLSELQKIKKDLDLRIPWFELREHVDTPTFYAYFGDLNLLLLPLVDSIRTNEEEIKNQRQAIKEKKYKKTMMKTWNSI